MAKDTTEMQMAFTQYMKALDVEESLLVLEAGDCRQSYLDLLLHKLFPSNQSDATKVKRKSSRSLLKKVFCFEGALI